MAVVGRLVACGTALDWTRVEFQEALPNNLTCNLCGVIPMRCMRLSCDHQFCKGCYGQIVSEQRPRCPFDRKDFQSHPVRCEQLDISRLDYCKVRCLNAKRGCEFVGTFKSLQQHVDQDCRQHVVNCMRCGQEVIQGKFLAHFSGKCQASLEAPSRTSAAAALQEVRRTRNLVESAVDALAQATRETDDSINSVLACSRAYVQVVKDLQGFLGNCIPQIKQTEREILQSVGDCAAFVLKADGVDRARCPLRCFSAKLRSRSQYLSDSFKVAGYSLQISQHFSWGISESLTWMYLSLIVSKSRSDRNLVWPLRKTFCIVLEHPEDSSRNAKHAVMPTEVEDADAHFENLRTKGAKPPTNRDMCFKVSLLRDEGFILDDALRVTVEAEG
ncbi:hypothetical protein HPB47_027536 [Ixodes persulcatus]|uniref:Uncharacterized protein n=1 Tax=Ixodes persulcatus TaxID=34615 RepID=A0AC60PVK1_IXOPE|nr:hypothetical protein HPB47_027536 [Ixodes persulcatus]